MTRFARQESCCRGPLSRRSFLHGAVASGMLGSVPLSLADMMKAREASAAAGLTTRDDTSVIFVWLPGGPPHMEMYDLKPHAPAEYRGF
ncbi:MAG: hypothetical protein R3B96_13250 [Pirellulaceae bacterium]